MPQLPSRDLTKASTPPPLPLRGGSGVAVGRGVVVGGTVVSVGGGVSVGGTAVGGTRVSVGGMAVGGRGVFVGGVVGGGVKVVSGAAGPQPVTRADTRSTTHNR
jgi:hypothetical protein